jgi:LacI family repressor for deo operon, udp, cdd, tsx, nupC, and nupG
MNESRPIAQESVATPTVGDVARRAGVSTATVSRVLSRPDQVSPKTRKRVMQAVEETGYRLNHAARNLRQGRTGGIVVLVPYLSNPFFSTILAAIARVASEAALNVLVVDTRETDAANQRILDYLHSNRADGLIVLDGNMPRQFFSPSSWRPPVVFACEAPDVSGQPTVTVDNRQGARMAVMHLLGLGHRKIGYVAGPPHNVLTGQRHAGYIDALTEAKRLPRPDWLFEGDFTMQSGSLAARRWLAMAGRPTAVFCASDAMACGFVSELHRQGVRVPQDVSVVGFDDIDIAAHFIPGLTTIRQPRARIGAAAAGMLIDLLRSPTGEAGRNSPEIDGKPLAVELPVELIVRESTAAPAGTG